MDRTSGRSRFGHTEFRKVPNPDLRAQGPRDIVMRTLVWKFYREECDHLLGPQYSNRQFKTLRDDMDNIPGHGRD